MTPASGVPETVTREQPPRSARSLLLSMEIDTRLLGMAVVIAVIWIGFNIMSGGNFLTPRNLWNLSVQSSSIAVMATGMVLIIVSRNIDLSVGSILGLTGYTMAMVQAVWIPSTLGLGFDQPYTWILALAIGLVLGAAIGGFQGFIIAYSGVPAVIVTFALLGGGPVGSVGELASWVVGIIACVGIIYTLIASRRRRRRYDFPLRPMWAEVTVGVVGSAAVLGAIAVANHYYWPEQLAIQHFGPAARLDIPVGIAIPVLLMLGVTLVMTFMATRRRFGRYVFSIGGNPEAAELGGINTRRTIMMTYVLMGILCAISGAIQTARLNSAVTSLGTQSELDVIAAAVIGGTSFSGGIGTIPGAILGAVVMQSLRSGMLLLRVDSPIQDIVVGTVLVLAVGLDAFMRRRSA
jgi:D-xylose transport system permease protein